MFGLYENISDVRIKNNITLYEGCTLGERDNEPKLIKVFNTLDESLKELSKYTSEVYYINSTSKYKVYNIKEYYVQEFDEYELGDIWEFSKMN